MDILTLLGVVVGFAALLGGNFLEGGSIYSLLNLPAAIIVFGGTLGAAIVQTPRENLKRAIAMGSNVLFPTTPSFDDGIKKIIRWAIVARRDGLLGLEPLLEKEKEPFSKKGLVLLVDGNETSAIRRILEIDLITNEQRDVNAAGFYESMGGYAPTIGIIGAVIGLIQVMQNLADPTQLGPGIAVAFVATIYGVTFANLLLLPIASKLKQQVGLESLYRELVIEGLIAIADGENPKTIEAKLRGYLP